MHCKKVLHTHTKRSELNRNYLCWQIGVIWPQIWVFLVKLVLKSWF